MLSTKVSTQYWAKSPQKSGLEVDKTNYDPATKKAEGAEEKSIGERLNEIANPGGADPLKPKRRPSSELGKDDFLKLMMAQIKHQDPTNPLQSHEMAAQLAQFTSLEQLFNVNKNLESMVKGQEPSQKYEVLNFLGKSIKADTKEIFWAKGDKLADLRFNLAGDAAKLKVTIIDANGDEVRSFDAGSHKKGLNKISWNGLDKRGQEVRPGQYVFRIDAENTAGRQVGVITETNGTITGVNFTPEGPLLMVGDQKVRLQDIKKIEDEVEKKKAEESEKVNQASSEKSQEGLATPETIRQAIKAESKPEVKVASNEKIPLENRKDGKGEMRVGGRPFGR